MPNNCTIYKHITPPGKVYIGITEQRPQSRWGKNGNGYKNAGRFRHAIKKYGWDNIQHIILAKNISPEDASAAERKLIKRYDATNPKNGYNISAGGYSGSPGHHLSESAREKIRMSKMGCKNPMYGKHLSDEHKARISEANKGKPKSGETIAKMRLAQSNRSEETRKKLSDAQKKVKVLCVETGRIYEGISIAARDIGVSSSNISNCIHGMRKTCAEYHWKAVE